VAEPTPVHDHSAINPNKACNETPRTPNRADFDRLPKKDGLSLELLRVSLRVGHPRQDIFEREIFDEETFLLPSLVGIKGKFRGPTRFLAKESFELTLPLSALFWRKQVGD